MVNETLSRPEGVRVLALVPEQEEPRNEHS